MRSKGDVAGRPWAASTAAFTSSASAIRAGCKHASNCTQHTHKAGQPQVATMTLPCMLSSMTGSLVDVVDACSAVSVQASWISNAAGLTDTVQACTPLSASGRRVTPWAHHTPAGSEHPTAAPPPLHPAGRASMTYSGRSKYVHIHIGIARMQGFQYSPTIAMGDETACSFTAPVRPLHAHTRSQPLPWACVVPALSGRMPGLRPEPQSLLPAPARKSEQPAVQIE
jgi:hypothetical protein